MIFIEESNDFVFTHDFARFVRDSGNYFVIVNREPLYSLTYSINEIYTLSSYEDKEVFRQVYCFSPVTSMEYISTETALTQKLCEAKF